MNKWIMRHILYKPMKKQLDRKLIEQGGFRGEANDLYNIMWHFALTGVFTEEQKEELRQVVPYTGPRTDPDIMLCESECYRVYFLNAYGEDMGYEDYESLQDMDEQCESSIKCGFKVVKVLKVFELAKEVKTKWTEQAEAARTK